MTFNYPNFGNHTLENMLPLFGNISNGISSLSNHPNFINQLAAMISTAENANATVNGNMTASVVSLSSAKNTTNTSSPRVEAPNITSLSSPSKGTAPMDLENDLEQESLTLTTSNTGSGDNSSRIPSSTQAVQNKLNEKFALQNTSLYLNSLMSNTGYMFFPTNNTSATTTANNAQLAASAAANNLLLDPASIMAAAMQQVQQNYTSFSMPAATGTDTPSSLDSNSVASTNTTTTKEVIKTKSCILFPPNPNAPPPTIRDRPLGCRTVFVGGLPENITEEIIREIFEPCGEITTLRMSKKNFCHIRYRLEKSIDRAIFLSGYRLKINSQTEQTSFGRLHVDYAQARDDQYDYECKQRQLQREQRHRERLSMDRLRSQSPPPIPHYTDHEASVISESLRNNDTFQKAVQTICIWLERGDCTKRNANVFYTMIQITHGHVRRLHTDKQSLEDALRKTRENYRKQMLTMSSLFTQIEKVFNAASHKKVWDHFTKAQRKNIDQWKKLASELRSVQVEDDEMEMSDDDREYHNRSHKRSRYESDSLKEENDSLRCQLEAMRNEMSLERTDIKHDSDFREKQIKVLQETIRNMQTQLLQTKMQEERDAKTIQELNEKLKEAGVKQLLLKTKIKETTAKLKDKDSVSSVLSSTNDIDVLSDDLPSNEKNSFEKYTDLQLGKLNTFKRKSSIKKEIIDLANNNDDEDDDDDDESANYVEAIDDAQINGKNIPSHDEAEQQNGNNIIIQNQIILQNDNKLILEKDEPNQNDSDTMNDEKSGIDNGEWPKKQAEKSDQNCETISSDLNNETKLQINENKLSISPLDAKVIALATAYLVIHPHGATTNSLCLYLKSINKTIDLDPKELILILKRYNSLFEFEILNQIDLDSEKPETAETNETIWRFSGFKKQNIIVSKNLF